jgi:hypothetical protein
VTQGGQKRHGFPVAIRDLGPEPHAARRPSPQGRHVGLGPGFVDEDETRRINSILIFLPLRPSSRDVGTILLAGQNGFF